MALTVKYIVLSKTLFLILILSHPNDGLGYAIYANNIKVNKKITKIIYLELNIIHKQNENDDTSLEVDFSSYL